MDFLDVDTKKDVKLFVDPTLLPAIYENIVKDFLTTVFFTYHSGNKNGALSLFTHSKECNAIHLGFSSGKSKGKGISLEMLNQFFIYVFKAEELFRSRLLTPAALPIFIKNFSRDRMSDLLVSLLKKELVQYSLEQARLHGLPISKKKAEFDYWNIETHSWDTFESEYVLDPDGEMLILLPKRIVNRNFVMTPGRYVSNIFTHLQSLPENIKSDGKVLTKKELREREINQQYSESKEKNYILDVSRETPSYFVDYYDTTHKFSEFKSLSDDQLVKYLTEK